MISRPFKQVDVFTSTPYFGNPLAVVLDGSGIDDAAMQRFAAWTNLSETTFVLPPTEPTADYRVRIFTPGGELPFAGHPTLGSCHAWLQAGGKPKAAGHIVQQSAVGLVAIRREGERLAFAAPPVKRIAPSPTLLAKVAAALGLKAQQIVTAQLLDNGPAWLGLLLADADTVLTLKPDHRALRELGQKVGVAGLPSSAASPVLIARSNREARAFARTEEAPADIEVRAFAAPVGIEEDPVTGSFNASLAQWLIADGHLPESYVAAQGQTLGRAGRVHIQRDADGQVWVGGDSVTCVDGSVML
ncbi:PhzF family phenazine biosynthesis protein [Variovorax ginsengisoli]|uniref:PhzF family phenazine biosynthesis protein n=1 Tax=Variovorax ginsengisoli TaxID=363844 RepID=A0ABT8S934_9BURK|nr:PhzF family phenazine biosynthesis protein [Variovorax ginsengisoli]MDN8616250.1 PhzF family phenazine biosynthesis protein [Variovorax ginsengisoli]MDO1535420.1 PhzF family phenazine biosynthesis protein [Variovorax ginsengisoli]